MEDVPVLQVVFRPPVTRDATSIWKLARASTSADSNSPYFYLMWCHEFPSTCVVATVGNRVVGFLLGYQRQDRPDTLVVWQEEIDPSYHVLGLRLSMLNEVIRRNADRGISFVETTATPYDKGIVRVVERFARQRAARVVRRVLFAAGYFPDAHATEILYSIGPFEVLRN